MDSYELVPPNENSRVYRSFSPPLLNTNKFLDFIETKNGHMLIGSSNLNGRKWNGSVCYYENYNKDKFNTENMKAYHHTNAGVIDGKFLIDTRLVVVGQDSGELKVLQITENNQTELVNQNINLEHEDTITEISIWEKTKNFLTSTFDSCIKIWEFSESGVLHCLHTYNNAHLDIISSANAHPNDPNLFVSCSYDKRALLWDRRSESCGTVIHENEFSNLTRIEWHQTKSNIVAIGNSAGCIYLVDIREPNEFLSRNDYYKRSIHRTKFNTNGLLAVCADNTKVIILDCTNDEIKLAYENDEHTDMVRGLAWHEDKLVTCGWDQNVIFHQGTII